MTSSSSDRQGLNTIGHPPISAATDILRDPENLLICVFTLCCLFHTHCLTCRSAAHIPYHVILVWAQRLIANRSVSCYLKGTWKTHWKTHRTKIQDWEAKSSFEELKAFFFCLIFTSQPLLLSSTGGKLVQPPQADCCCHWSFLRLYVFNGLIAWILSLGGVCLKSWQTRKNNAKEGGVHVLPFLQWERSQDCFNTVLINRRHTQHQEMQPKSEQIDWTNKKR